MEQDHGAGELDPGEEICGEFVVAGGDCTKVFEFVEEALDEIALTIEREITIARRLAVGLGRNHRREGLVAKQRSWIDRFQQRLKIEFLNQN